MIKDTIVFDCKNTININVREFFLFWKKNKKYNKTYSTINPNQSDMEE